MKTILKNILYKCGFEIKRLKIHPDELEKIYIKNGYIPWSKGYVDYKNHFIRDILSNPDFLIKFRNNNQLPERYGIGLDERCIEYPWLFSHINSDAKVYLDAGSALNHQFILENNFWNDKSLTIFTLAPEANCFWNKNISYNFGDLRQLPYKDHWFDEVVCISTLEHIGMNNSMYSPHSNQKEYDIGAYQVALKEMSRILMPGGRLLLTVPFGKYKNYKIFQQFNNELLEKAALAFGAKEQKNYFYRYTSNGWQNSSANECNDCEYSGYAISAFKNDLKGVKPEIDNAAAARSVACVIWKK